MNHTQRAKQQKSNLDKLDKILANLPEAQYDHSEEAVSEKKKPGRPKKSVSDVLKKQTAAKKQPAKKETEKNKKEVKEIQN